MVESARRERLLDQYVRKRTRKIFMSPKSLAPATPTSLDHLRAKIRGAGMRCTAARLLVMQFLVEANGPKTHVEVSEALVVKGFDRATMYRNLIELTECGLVTRVELGDHVWRFELKTPESDGTNHPHFVCVDCGEVMCLSGVKVSVAPSAGHKPPKRFEVTSVLLKGRCGACK